MKNLGLKDFPLEAFEEETLGLGVYAESLSDFIRKCETPLTIALQGDWGSGKTSLMNLIKLNLKNTNTCTIWFNTWQYSQFKMQDDLSTSLLSHLVEELGTEFSKTAKKTISWLGRGAKAFAVGAASLVGQGDTAKDIINEIVTNDDFDTAKYIKRLKKEIETLVREKIEKANIDRIVVFVDDLDRLLPEKAVEVLEIFKLFLDVPGCVYVLACDYHVIEQGLEKKFGIKKEQLKGKSFFDKIIQLPFSMPLGNYDVKNYIRNLLNKIGVSFEENDLILYVDMINYSVGFNPRAMKRLFNSMLLLNLVAERKNLFAESSVASRNEKQKIIFGSLCLQTAFEPVYRFLQRHSGSLNPELLESLKDESLLKNDEQFYELRKEFNGVDEDIFRRLSQFMETFFEGVQLKSDADHNKLSQSEVEALKEILSFSSITSVSAATSLNAGVDYNERYLNRDFIRSLINELGMEYKIYLDTLGIKFNIYQSRDSSAADLYFWVESQDKAVFSFDFIIDKTLCVKTCARNKKSKEFGKNWIDAYCTELFPERKFNLEAPNEYGLLMEKELASLTRSEKEALFRSDVKKILDILLQKISTNLYSTVV